MAVHQTPVNALHRAIFASLCSDQMPRQAARAAWTKIAKGQTASEYLMRRWRLATRLAREQVGALLEETNGDDDDRSAE